MGRVGALWMWLILAAALLLGAVATPRAGAQSGASLPPPAGCGEPASGYTWWYAGAWTFAVQGAYEPTWHDAPAGNYYSPAEGQGICGYVANWSYGPDSAYQVGEFRSQGPWRDGTGVRWSPRADQPTRDMWPGVPSGGFGYPPVRIGISWYNPVASGTLHLWVAVPAPTPTPVAPTLTPGSGGGGSGGGGSGGGSGGSGGSGGGGSGGSGGGGSGGATPTPPVPGWCGMVPQDPCYVEWISWRTAVAELRATDAAGGSASLPQPPLLTAAAGAATVAAVVSQPTPTPYGARERATAEAALTAGPVAASYTPAGPGPVMIESEALALRSERYDFGCPISYPPWGLEICIRYVYLQQVRIGPINIAIDMVVLAALILVCIGFVVRR